MSGQFDYWMEEVDEISDNCFRGVLRKVKAVVEWSVEGWDITALHIVGSEMRGRGERVIESIYEDDQRFAGTVVEALKWHTDKIEWTYEDQLRTLPARAFDMV